MTNHIQDLCEKLQHHARRASGEASSLEYAAASLASFSSRSTSIKALETIALAMEQLMQASAIAVELSIRAGNSQKQTADALGVPASTLAGAKKEFS